MNEFSRKIYREENEEELLSLTYNLSARNYQNQILIYGSAVLVEI